MALDLVEALVDRWLDQPIPFALRVALPLIALPVVMLSRSFAGFPGRTGD